MAPRSTGGGGYTTYGTSTCEFEEGWSGPTAYQRANILCTSGGYALGYTVEKSGYSTGNCGTYSPAQYIDCFTGSAYRGTIVPPTLDCKQ
jgi:hypothetical protein